MIRNRLGVLFSFVFSLIVVSAVAQGNPQGFGCNLTITCPPNITTIADSGICGASVSYSPPVVVNGCGSNGSITFNYTGSLQTYTVPVGVTSISIDASGAQGGSVTTSCTATGGLGARMVGDFVVTPGEVLSVLVGQQGLTNGSDAGGGGGSFVVRTGNVCLMAAGGGGGASNNIGQCGTNLNGIAASITTSGTASANGATAGGTNGNGGGATNGSGGGGGGFLTNGIPGTGNANSNGKSYLNGGAGGLGNNNDAGGYGGGGAGWFTGGNGGGGGGYSGGATNSSQPFSGGGGGGSYNAGTNQVNTAGFQTGNGRVVISYYVPNPVTTTMTSGLASGGTFPIGITTVTYSSTDGGSGNGSCSFTVEVLDTIAPAISCPPNDTVSNDPGTCGAVVTYSAPTAVDACPVASVSLSTGLASGSTFPQGNTVVTYEAQDSSGNVSSCAFNVSVIVDDASSQSISICDGESITIGNNIYSTTGTYIDTLINGGGCDSLVTTNLTVSPAVNVATTTNGGTISAVASSATYQWIDCGNNNSPISGANNQSFQPSIDGNYAVIVTEGNCSDTSACAVVVGVSQAIGTTMVLHPNPTTGRVNLVFGKALEEVQIEVFDVAGKRLFIKTEGNTSVTQLDFSNFVNAIYIVKISTSLGQEVVRVMKQD